MVVALKAHRIQGCEARFAVTDRRFPSDRTGFARTGVALPRGSLGSSPDPGQRDAVLDAVKDEPLRGGQGLSLSPHAGACGERESGAILDSVCARRHWRRRMVGTKKRFCGRTKKLDLERRIRKME
jgi:hypothetical protein